jgi:hypothetical protein
VKYLTKPEREHPLSGCLGQGAMKAGAPEALKPLAEELQSTRFDYA